MSAGAIASIPVHRLSGPSPRPVGAAIRDLAHADGALAEDMEGGSGLDLSPRAVRRFRV